MNIISQQPLLSCAGLTRASVLFAKKLDRRVKPGDDSGVSQP
jgi:hypothetical protein